MKRFLATVATFVVCIGCCLKWSWFDATWSEYTDDFSPKRNRIQVANTDRCQVEMELKGSDWKDYEPGTKRNPFFGDTVEGATRKLVVEVRIEPDFHPSAATVVSSLAIDRYTPEIVPIAAFITQTGDDEHGDAKRRVPYGETNWSATKVATRQRLGEPGDAKLHIGLGTDFSPQNGYYTMNVPLTFKEGQGGIEVACKLPAVQKWADGVWIDGYEDIGFNSQRGAAHFFPNEYRAPEFRSMDSGTSQKADVSSGEHTVALAELPSGGRLTISELSFRQLAQGSGSSRGAERPSDISLS